MKNVKILSLKKNGTNYEQKTVPTDNRGKNIWPKWRVKKNWTIVQNADICFL